MITQAFKRWLQKVFGWFSRRKPVEAEYAHAVSSLSKSVTQEPTSRTSSDVSMSQPGIAPRIVGQGETSYSTMGEWPERVIQSAQPPPTPNDKTDPPPPSASTPIIVTPSAESAMTIIEKPTGQSEVISPSAPLPTPTPGHQLEFLQYLVKRGIVNEGFAEGQTPEQYRKQQ